MLTIRHRNVRQSKTLGDMEPGQVFRSNISGKDGFYMRGNLSASLDGSLDSISIYRLACAGRTVVVNLHNGCTGLWRDTQPVYPVKLVAEIEEC
jgi:hypothetical protein